MAELLKVHQMVNLDRLRLADPIDIVTSEVNQHYMFCSVLL